MGRASTSLLCAGYFIPFSLRGLVYCMEYFEQNMHDWLNEALEVRRHTVLLFRHRPNVQGYGEDDYVLFDCPGQTELYSHLTVFHTFMNYLQNDGWTVRSTLIECCGRQGVCRSVLPTVWILISSPTCRSSSEVASRHWLPWSNSKSPIRTSLRRWISVQTE